MSESCIETGSDQGRERSELWMATISNAIWQMD